MAQIVYNEEENMFDYVEPELDAPVSDETDVDSSVDSSVLGVSDDSAHDSSVDLVSSDNVQPEDVGNPADSTGGTQSEQSSTIWYDSEGNVIDNENMATETDNTDSDYDESQADTDDLETPSFYVVDSNDYIVYSSASTDGRFSVQPWQTALASGRSLGEHYIIYGSKHYYSGSGYNSYYWDYYAIIGSEIDFDESSSVYTYTDCDLYHYYEYNNSVTYTLEKASGTVSGNSYLCYSDLYFDYVGNDSFDASGQFICALLLLILCGLSILNLRKR